MRKGDLAVRYGLLGIKVPALREVAVLRGRLGLTTLRSVQAYCRILLRILK